MSTARLIQFPIERRAKALRLGEGSHDASIGTSDGGAITVLTAERLQNTKRRLARSERAEILSVVMRECGISARDLASILDADTKHVSDVLAGARPFEAELLLPQAARAMFLRLMGERHEQRRRAGR